MPQICPVELRIHCVRIGKSENIFNVGIYTSCVNVLKVLLGASYRGPQGHMHWNRILCLNYELYNKSSICEFIFQNDFIYSNKIKVIGLIV